MDEGEQSDDSSGSESELQQQVEQLQAVVDGNPYQYESHMQLIKLLRQLGDLDGARKARNAMSDAFPLTEELWLGWLQDELPLVTVPEASVELRQLFERATADYLSVGVWSLYAQFAMDQMSTVPEGVAFPRDVFERAIISCGLHVPKAGEVWDLYRGFEMAILKSLQQMQQESPEDESLKVQVESQFERVDKIFKRQLGVPLIGMQDTLVQYRQFSDTSLTLPSYGRALKRLESFMPFEEELSATSPPSLEGYRSYLTHSRKTKEDPMFINTLYQRAVADHCLEVDLWKDYLTYLNVTFPKVESVLLPPHSQAVHNCPWVAELWVSYGVAMERVGAGEHETVAVFEKGLTQGNLSTAKDSLQLWMAYIDYLRRQVHISDDQEGDSPDLVGLRKTFKRARDTLETEYGRHGDPADSLACYQARLEARCYGNVEESRFLWDDIIGRHGREARYWIQYADMERYYGDAELCRKILYRGVNSASDDPELVIERLLQFEREDGDLGSYETALERCAAQLRRLGERREKAAQKEQESTKKHGRKPGKKPTDDTGKQKSPQKQQQKVGNKRKRVQKGQVFYDDDNEEEKERETLSKKQRVNDRSSDVAVPTESSLRQQPVTAVGGDPIAMETAEGTETKRVRNIPEPPGRPQPKEGESEGGRGRGRGRERGRDGGGGREGESERGGGNESGKETRTVFVSNLKMSITKEDVEEKFSECGTIAEVRLVKTQSRGKANAFAYVEYASSDGVEEALKLEHSELKGRIIFVSILREKGASAASKPTSFQGDNKATVFVSNLQHNANEQELKDLFGKCGEVKEVRLVRNKNGRPKGFAYVEFVNESSAGTAVLQYDNYLMGMKRLNVAISNPPKRKGEFSSRTTGRTAQFSGGSSQLTQAGPNGDDVKFVRPTFVPSRLKTQDQSEAPKKRANIGLVPRVLARQEGVPHGAHQGGREGEGKEGGGGEGKEGGERETMDTAPSKPVSKMSNDDFRNLFNK